MAGFRFRGLPDFPRKNFQFSPDSKTNKQENKTKNFVLKVIQHDRVNVVKLLGKVCECSANIYSYAITCACQWIFWHLVEILCGDCAWFGCYLKFAVSLITCPTQFLTANRRPTRSYCNAILPHFHNFPQLTAPWPSIRRFTFAWLLCVSPMWHTF